MKPDVYFQRAVDLRIFKNEERKKAPLEEKIYRDFGVRANLIKDDHYDFSVDFGTPFADEINKYLIGQIKALIESGAYYMNYDLYQVVKFYNDRCMIRKLEYRDIDGVSAVLGVIMQDLFPEVQAFTMCYPYEPGVYEDEGAPMFFINKMMVNAQWILFREVDGEIVCDEDQPDYLSFTVGLSKLYNIVRNGDEAWTW